MNPLIISGNELMTAAQGLDFRREEMGAGTDAAYNLVRQHVPFLENDAPLSPYIEAARQLVTNGIIKEAVEERLEIRD